MENCDNHVWYNFGVENITVQHGGSVSFMEKPYKDKLGSGFHFDVNLMKNGVNVF